MMRIWHLSVWPHLTSVTYIRLGWYVLAHRAWLGQLGSRLPLRTSVAGSGAYCGGLPHSLLPSACRYYCLGLLSLSGSHFISLDNKKLKMCYININMYCKPTLTWLHGSALQIYSSCTPSSRRKCPSKPLIHLSWQALQMPIKTIHITVNWQHTACRASTLRRTWKRYLSAALQPANWYPGQVTAYVD